MEKLKVLLIEDDDNARNTLARTIRKDGYDVIAVENGKVGLEAFKKESPLIVISDLKMPEVSGLDVLREVKKVNPNVQFILITAFGETETAINALRIGCLDYIKKPLDVDQLYLALGRAQDNISKFDKVKTFPTLLLAEDDTTTRERLSKVLKKEGWHVLGASDGEEALKIFGEHKIDIFLTDLKMPKKDGLTCLHESRQITDDFESIVLSGYGDENDAIEAMREGAINFLKKPIDIDQLIVIVQKAIEKLHLVRSLKYRVRELELSKQIISLITPEKEIIVDIREDVETSSKEFGQNLVNSIPTALAVVDQEMNIVLVNDSITSFLEHVPKKIEKNFVKQLQKIGVRDITYEGFLSALKDSFNMPMGEFQTISVTKYCFITFTPFTFLDKRKKERLVLIIIRGERISKKKAK